MAEVSHQCVESDCLNTDVELLMLDPDTHFAEYFEVSVAPTESVALKCRNCPLRAVARVGFNAVAIAFRQEPEAVCKNLRPEPDAS